MFYQMETGCLEVSKLAKMVLFLMVVIVCVCVCVRTQEHHAHRFVIDANLEFDRSIAGCLNVVVSMRKLIVYASLVPRSHPPSSFSGLVHTVCACV